MIGQTISHHKILEKLGEGGMGVVYKAHDTKLDRDVALKFLPHHLTATTDEQARFLQEARAASALSHPNICTIFYLEDVDDRQFIVMELVDGKTLKQMVPVQKLRAAIDYAIQIGEALQEAHTKGVVHRDIKTENIMVNSKNQIKVMDFGLAKLKGAMKLTKTSSTVGTLAYMAPEQIRGEPVDGRSDIFSFGVVLFEMLTGHLPFRGEHDAALMYSIVNEKPHSLLQYLPEAPPELLHVMNRALEKEPEDRYQTVSDMVIDLKRLKKETSKVSRLTPNIQRSQESSESAVRPSDRYVGKSRIPWKWIALSGIMILVLAVSSFLLFWHRTETIESIAVLPFVNVNADSAVEFLSDGISESIINSLSQIRSLRVIPRSTAFSYKGKNIDFEVVARTLNVRAILTGKVVQKGEDLHIQTELVDAVRKSQLWGQQYVRKISDILDIRREVVKEVSNRLELRLSTDDNAQLSRGLTKDKEAYQLYLKGRYNWNKRTGDGMRIAIKHFEEAIEKDPAYVSAYAGLADCYVLLCYYGRVPPSRAYPKAKAAALKALEIDSTIAEAHTTLGQYYFRYEWNWAAAEREFLRGLHLNPNYPTGHQWYAEMLSVLGRHEEALREIKRAQELDPLSLIINATVGDIYSSARKYHEAMDQHKTTIEMDSTFSYAQNQLAFDYQALGLYSDAIQQWLRTAKMNGVPAEEVDQVRNAYARNGQIGFWKKRLELLLDRSKKAYVAPWHIAGLYWRLGQKDQALFWLRRGIEFRDEMMVFLNRPSAYDSIRSDPRFIGLLREVGFQK